MSTDVALGRSLTILLMALLGSVFGRDAQAAEDAGFQAAINAIVPDPNETLFETHYVTSNERHHGSSLSYLGARGGVFIGIGTDQNFELIPKLRPSHVVMVDFDQWVVDAHWIYAHLFRTRATPRAFIAFFREEKIAAKRRELRKIARSPEQARTLDKIFMRYRQEILTRLLGARTRLLSQSGKGYLNNQEDYDAIRELVIRGRYAALRGDLTGKASLTSLATTLRAQGLKVGAVSFSNAEQYFSYTKQFQANMRAFDYTSEAMLLRTFRVSGRHYEYYLQSMSAFLEWMSPGGAKTIQRLISKRIATPHPRIFVLPGRKTCLTGLCPSINTCPDVPFTGCCSREVLTWCIYGEVQSVDCALTETSCGWSKDLTMYTCGGGDEAPLSFEMTCHNAL